MFSKLHIMAATTLLGLFSTTVSMAAENSENKSAHGMKHHRKGMHEGNCFESLNLSTEQREKIVALHKEFDPKFDAIRSQIYDYHKQLRDIYILNKGTDQTKPLEEKMTALKTDSEKLHDDMHSKMKEIFTSAQLKACPNFEKEMKRGCRWDAM